MPIAPSHLMRLSVSLLLLLAGQASAQQPCSDWYINKILKEGLNCSPQDIDDICSGRRPRPPENATTCATDRPRLEVAIMRVGTKAYCPANITKEAEFEHTYVR